ncbi:cyclic nucleotide gated channel 1 [Prunus dulcis]|uniref:Cyclic nucleotide gated channel 1 n=1 Tax=Prunus dulcis TaxID=3755 RepID=A0A4Y1R1I2_PRUDU|nr:cyclic nucleotide gated channel 1 [Prunus dulcis]
MWNSLGVGVLGAIWYFFAIQRMAICWYDACQKENKCNTSSFGCRDHHVFRNITFLNDICPISPVNVGIYITVLQFGIPGSTNFFQKFSNCFCGFVESEIDLLNLLENNINSISHMLQYFVSNIFHFSSSLGSNLEPSVDGWENLFAAFISITGLLLFLYLIGNLQFDTQRIEAHRHNMKMEQKMEEKGREIELWLSKNGIPKSFKSQIMGKARQEREENRDADLDYIHTILPLDLQTRIKNCMPMARLKQCYTSNSKGRDIVVKLSKYQHTSLMRGMKIKEHPRHI